MAVGDHPRRRHGLRRIAAAGRSTLAVDRRDPAITLPMTARLVADLRVEGQLRRNQETPLTWSIPGRRLHHGRRKHDVDLRKFDFR